MPDKGNVSVQLMFVLLTYSQIHFNSIFPHTIMMKNRVNIKKPNIRLYVILQMSASLLDPSLS